MMLFRHKWNKCPFSEQERCNATFEKKLLLCKNVSNKYDLLIYFPTTVERPILTMAAEACNLEYPSHPQKLRMNGSREVWERAGMQVNK